MNEGRTECDWQVWRQSFDLPVHTLWNVPQMFPELVSPDHDSGPTLNYELLRAIAIPSTLDPTAQFARYLDEGEFPAASALLPLIAPERRTAEQHRAELASRREQLELEYNQEHAKFTAVHQQLVALGERALDDPSFSLAQIAVNRLREAGRLGPAIGLLRANREVLEVDEAQALQRLDDDIARLRGDLAANSALSASLAQELAKRAQLAERYRDERIYELASATVRRAREALETGILSSVDSTESSAHYRLRPLIRDHIRARHIVAWLERGEPPSDVTADSWKHFFNTWLPAEWRPGQKPDDAAYTAIERLARSTQGIPFTGRNSWVNFLKDFFDLLGRRDHQPTSVDENALPQRPVADRRQRGKVGFWLGWCKPSLAFRGTFIDPERIGVHGLPVILWHRPRETRGPRPSNLEAALERRSLRLRPILVFANEPVDPEDRRALQRVAPSAALLDETALLRIILSHTALPEGFDPQPMRQMHFAATVSAQLPAKQASPFTESGAASDVMFFGRNDVLQEMQDPNGPTILYGGRRLGKSSILHQLQRLFVNAAPSKNIGLYVDCADAGMSRESINQLVRRITGQLRSYVPPSPGIVNPPFADQLTVPNSVPEFVEEMRGLLRAFPEHRLLLLLDEADTLCAYLDVLNTSSILPEQRLGWGFRALVAEFRGRFDIRLAGFQEIHRATTSPGGPFFNFRTGSTSLPLKVFRPDEARELLVSTLRNLAVEFDSPALVDRILEFAGRHPALLQESGKRLYEQVRARSHTRWRVSAEDVDALMLSADLRRSVVTTIHLNVSRPTRAQRTLALLLYLWVQEIMAPEPGSSPRETRTARDLFDLVERELGATAGRQLDVAAIDAYLGDLVVLGVLERRGTAYAFAYRAFATLLYHDYFAGGLNQNTIVEQWVLLDQESELGRVVIPAVDGGHTLSPLSRDAQERLTSALGNLPVLLLGPAGSGLSLTAQWVARQAPLEGGTAGRVVDLAAATTGAALRQELSKALTVSPSSDWQYFWEVANERAATLGDDDTVTTIVLDTVDPLAEGDDLPLVWFDEAIAPPQEHLFALMHALTHASRGRLRFLCSGSLATARFWVDYGPTLGDGVSLIRTERLKQAELGAWLETARLIPSRREAVTRTWDLTRGDWRLLAALRHWLRQPHHHHQDAIDVDEDDLGRFMSVLQDPARCQVELPDLLARARDTRLQGLRTVTHAAQTFGMAEGSVDDWCEACRSIAEQIPSVQGWSTMRWESELRALVLLGEIGEVIARGERDEVRPRLIVNHDDPWLTLVAT